jgi:hypothetical protein
MHVPLFPSIIFSVFFTDKEPSEQKHSGVWTPVFPELGTVDTRLKTFKQYPLPIDSLAEAGFFNYGKYFTIESVL